MSYTPQISVLLSTYNDEKYINECIDSVLNQSFRDFEFVIIDDGSTDRTYDIISAINDPRIVIFRKENTGLIDSLNFGVSKCRGEYIARIDGDDICHVDRLKLQIEFLINNLEYSICGSNTIYIDGDGAEFGLHKYPISDEMIKTYMLFGSPLSHPAVMTRREVMVDNPYSHDYPVAEDYELWVRLSSRYKFFNIDKPLLYYRFYGGNVSFTKRGLARESRIKICETYFNYIFDIDSLNSVLYSFVLCDVGVSVAKYLDLADKLLLTKEFRSPVFRRYTIISWFILSLQKGSIRMLICNRFFYKYPFEYVKAICGYVDLLKVRVFVRKRVQFYKKK